MQTSLSASTSTAEPIARRLIFALATGAGLSVASIYYAQPILPLLGKDLSLSVSGMGLVPTLTQAGYALGILFLLPLGDRYDRRNIILIKSLVLALLLATCSLVSTLPTLLITSLFIGMAATLAQDIVPAAAMLAPAGRHGKTVGTVMTGLLLGILLSRTVSGLIGAGFGWRVMYQIAAASIVFIAIVLWRVLPRFQTHGTLTYPGLLTSAAASIVFIAIVLWRVLPRFQTHGTLTYPGLLTSMAGLWRRYPALRLAAYAQGLLSISFSAFWSVLAVMLSDHFHLGSAVAGGFGIAGAAGALAAPLSGALADKVGPGRVTQMGAGLVTLSFLSMLAMPLLPVHGQLLLIALAAIGFDLGLQSSLVAHQTLVYSLEPQARGRLNALLFTLVFIGMALGSVFGSKAYVLSGWTGVLILATVAGAAGTLIRLFAGRDGHGATSVTRPVQP